MSLSNRATKLLNDNTRNIDERSEFYEFFTPENMANASSVENLRQKGLCSPKAIKQQD